MKRVPVDRPCSRRGCSEPSFGRKGNEAYCTKHRVFVVMRVNAKRRGLAVPSWEDLELALPVDMKCQPCGRTMNWTKAEGASTGVTLQHDRAGAFRLICQGCNTKHSRMPADSFYELKPGQKHCAKCATVKPVEEFAADKSRPGGRKSHCRACCKAHYEANREYWRQRQKRVERD